MIKTMFRCAVCVLLVLAIVGCSSTSKPRIVSRNCTQVPDIYKVKRGDTLFQIAWSYCLNYLDVARWNDLQTPDLILVGQRLRLKPSAARIATQSKLPTRTQRRSESNRTTAQTSSKYP